MELKSLIIEMLEELDATRLKNVYFFIRGLLGLK